MSKIAKGKGYFLIRIHSAQASYKGTFWQNLRNTAKQVLVTSEVQLKPWIDDPLPQIQAARRIRPKQAVQLGLRSNLIDFIPAVLDKVSVKLSLVLDQNDRLEALSSAINGSGFLSTISLAEPTLATVKALGSASRAVLDAFLEPEAKRPILEFTGDFNIGTDDLHAGYYVLLGAADKDNPLPRTSRLSVTGTNLLVDGNPTDNWSYIILEVICTEARGDNPQAKWHKLLSDAEAQADQISRMERPSKEQRSAAFEKCQSLITEADTFIRADPNYLPEEAKQIIAGTFKRCRDTILSETAQRAGIKTATAAPWLDNTRELLGFREDKHVDQAVRKYAAQVRAFREIEKRRSQKDQEADAIRQEAETEDRNARMVS